MPRPGHCSNVSALASARFVTISLAHALTRYTVSAIETKIKRGVWIEGREWRRAPDGRVLIDMRGLRTVGRKSELRSTQEARDQFQFDELSLKHAHP